MESVALGLTDLRLSRIGFGCAGIAGHDYGPVSDEDALAAIEAALDCGVTFFDVADVYGLGRAEQLLGRALGNRRDVVIATKAGVRWDASGRTWRDVRAEVVAQAVEESLRRLRRDAIDLYQIHWPDGETPIAEAIEAMERCQRQGKVRHIGVCNVNAREIEEAIGTARLESLQAPASLIQREAEPLLRTCAQRHGMTPICYNTLAQGLLSGKYTLASRFHGFDVRQRSHLFQEPLLSRALSCVEALSAVAQRTGRTPAQVAIRWVLDSLPQSCAIVGIKSAAQAAENTCPGPPLSRDELDELTLALEGAA